MTTHLSWSEGDNGNLLAAHESGLMFRVATLGFGWRLEVISPTGMVYQSSLYEQAEDAMSAACDYLNLRDGSTP